MREEETAHAARERIGVLGGTFDPIHRGHLAIAEAARRAHRLDRVLLIPAAVPPHKPGAHKTGPRTGPGSSDAVTPFAHRLAMARLAAEGKAGLSVSDLEGRRRGASYTVDTLAELSRSHAGAELYFIIGEDTISELPLWRDLPRIASLARMVAVNRPGPRRSFSPRLFPEIPRETLARWESDRVEMPPAAIASRDVRRAIREGRPFEEWLAPEVAGYIRRHRLYGCGGLEAGG